MSHMSLVMCHASSLHDTRTAPGSEGLGQGMRMIWIGHGKDVTGDGLGDEGRGSRRDESRAQVCFFVSFFQVITLQRRRRTINDVSKHVQ
jgi:hypothetical protein